MHVVNRDSLESLLQTQKNLGFLPSLFPSCFPDFFIPFHPQDGTFLMLSAHFAVAARCLFPDPTLFQEEQPRRPLFWWPETSLYSQSFFCGRCIHTQKRVESSSNVRSKKEKRKHLKISFIRIFIWRFINAGGARGLSCLHTCVKLLQGSQGQREEKGGRHYGGLSCCLPDLSYLAAPLPP